MAAPLSPLCCALCPALQAGQFAEASKAVGRVEGHAKAVTTLLVANAYEQGDVAGGAVSGVGQYCQQQCQEWGSAVRSSVRSGAVLSGAVSGVGHCQKRQCCCC
jgi:hypothetical protein